MSTAIVSSSDNTSLIQYDDKQTGYRYADSGTKSFSLKDQDNQEIRPRSVSPLMHVINVNNPIQDIRQRWSGVVLSLNQQELKVRLEDLTNTENPDELVTLSIDEIDKKDQGLIKPGAQFYWYIGYKQGLRYSKERFSIIRFRRLPHWTDREIKESEKLAKEYADFFLTN